MSIQILRTQAANPIIPGSHAGTDEQSMGPQQPSTKIIYSWICSILFQSPSLPFFVADFSALLMPYVFLVLMANHSCSRGNNHITVERIFRTYPQHTSWTRIYPGV